MDGNTEGIKKYQVFGSSGTLAQEIESGFVMNRLLPTPTARDWRSEKASQETMDRNSRPFSETLGANTGLKLQPAFALWMQNFPEDYLELPFTDGEGKV